MSLQAPLGSAWRAEATQNASPLAKLAKPVVYGVGTALFIASLVYLALGVDRHWTAIRDVAIVRPGWLIASIAIYAVSHFTTGVAWPLILRAIGEPISIRDGLKIGFVAQVGKYLPGNIAHYFGRAALAKARGTKVRSSGISTAIELVCAMIGAGMIASMALMDRALPFGLPHPGFAVIVAIVLCGCAAASLVLPPKRLFLVACASGSIAVSLALSGLSAFALLSSIGAPAVPLALVVGSFALAWIAGFIIPGAPAGFGIRETVFIALVGPAVGAGAALTCAILHRVVTACVDLAVAMWGYWWFGSATRSKM
jgi:uncharacterized membrane protein YbhN (UPF0104 family)